MRRRLDISAMRVSISRAAVLAWACGLLLAHPATAGASINWYGDFEDGVTQHIPPDSPTSTAEGWRGSSYTNVEKTKLITEPRRQGNAAMSVTAGPKDLEGLGRQRVEVNSTLAAARGGQGDDTWYAWSAYFPSSSQSMANGVLTQWKWNVVGAGCESGAPNMGPNMSLSVGAALLFLEIKGGRCVLEPENKNAGLLLPLSLTTPVLDVWHDFIVHVHWSSSSHNGFVEAWYDGERVVSRTYVPNLYEDSTGQVIPVALRHGIYRGAGNPETEEPTSTIYFDATRVGDSYQDVASFNPSFERDLGDWQATADAGFAAKSFERSSAWASEGTHSLRRSGTHEESSKSLSLGAAQIGADRGTRVAPGRKYEIKADLHSYDPPASGGYRLRVSWFKANGSASSASDSIGAESGAGKTGDLTPTLNVTAPADAAFAQLRVEALSSTSKDFVDFAIDRIRFETDFGADQTGPELVPNPSFEGGTTGWQSRADSGLSLLEFKTSTAWTDELATALHLKGKHEGSVGQQLAYGATQPTGTAGMAVQGGTDYFARAVLDSVKAPANGGYRLRVSWFKSSGAPASTAPSESGLRGQGIAEGTKLPLFLAVTAPTDAAYASLAIEAISGTPGETTEFYVDNVTFRTTRRADRSDLLHIGTMEPPIPHLDYNLPNFFPPQEVVDYALATDGWYPTWDAGGEAIKIDWLRPTGLAAVDGEWSLRLAGHHDATTTEAIRGVATAEDTTGIPIKGGRSYRLKDKLRVTKAPAGGIQLGAQMLDANGKPIPGAAAQSAWQTGTGDFEQSLDAIAPSNARYIRITVLTKSAEASDAIDFLLDDVTLLERHTPRIEAESYPVNLKGSGFKAFTTKSGPFECEETSLKGTLSAPLSIQSLAAEYGKCKVFGLTATVTMNSCHYDLGVQNAGPPYTGTLGIACEKEGDKIEYKGFTSKGGALVCTAKILPQSGLTGVNLSNTGEKAERGIIAEAEVKGVKYELTGSTCGGASTNTDGVIKGTATLTGESEAKAPLGVYLTGESIPTLEAESYPVNLKGSGFKAFTTKSGPFECEETSLKGTLSAPSSIQSLAAEYGKCKVFGLTATVTMNSCHYDLGVQNAGPPYTGTLGIACEKEGDKIEYKGFTSKGGALVCTAKILPQSGLTGVNLSNTGEKAERGIIAEAEVKGVKYELTGSTCGGASTNTDGVIKGTTTLSGTNEKAAQIGVYLGGKA